MRRTTYLTNALKKYGSAAQYDAEAKKIMADKSLLAMILQVTVSELRGFDRSEIERFIEGVEVSDAPAITGMNTEDADPEEGMVRYDVHFYVIIPKKQRVKILLNVEIQKEYHASGDLMPRGIYYCCRIISGQKDREFMGDDYESIKKTYGIWLNLNAPKSEADSIFCVELTPKVLAGNADPENHKYDLMNVTMIGLNDDSYIRRATELHGYLGTIFSKKLKPEEKIRILKEEYGVEPTKEVKEGMIKLCNLGEALLEEGREEGREKGREEGRQEERENTRRESERADAAEKRAFQAEKELENLKRLLEAEYRKAQGDFMDRKTRHFGKKRGELWRDLFRKNKRHDK